MTRSKTFCILPWVHYKHSLNNEFSPCCSWSGPRTHSSNIDGENINLLKGKFMTNLRKKMLNGEYIQGCERCLIKERSNGKSPRTVWNDIFVDVHVESEQFYSIKYMEISFDNTCNFICKMCSGNFSSSWIKMEKSLNLKNNIAITNFNYDHIDFSQVEYLKILGGEPFYSKRFSAFLEHLNNLKLLEKINFEIVTNGSTFNQNIKILLKKAKSVAISVSIDGIDKVNSYQRINAEWNIIQHNFEEFALLVSKAKLLSIHTTLTILNFFDLHNLEIFKCEHPHTYSYDIHSQISLKHCPEIVREYILKYIKDKNISPDKQKSFEIFFKSYQFESEENWMQSLKFIKNLENLSSLKLKEVNCDFYNFLNNHYKYDTI